MQSQLEATLRLEKLLTPKSVTQTVPKIKPVTGTDRAEAWLKAHPDCYGMTLQEIADRTGCFKMDVSRAKKRMGIK